MSAEVSKSWFAVLNNPAERGYTGTPQEICEQLRDEWIRDSTTRSGAWAYCVSAAGLHHIHMVLEDKVAMRFSMVKKSYAEGMHFEATKGSRRRTTSTSGIRMTKKENRSFVSYMPGKFTGGRGNEMIWNGLRSY